LAVHTNPHLSTHGGERETREDVRAQAHPHPRPRPRRALRAPCQVGRRHPAPRVGGVEGPPPPAAATAAAANLARRSARRCCCGCSALHIHARAQRAPFSPAQVNQGTVLAVGPGRRSTTGDLIPPSVKAGDQVLLPEYGGTPVELGQPDEKEWFVFRDDEILGVLTGK
jgi:co-chaperonin GroES (HSP10)